jgi:hypothetical protein
MSNEPRVIKVRVFVGGQVVEFDAPGSLSTKQAKTGKGKGGKRK